MAILSERSISCDMFAEFSGLDRFPWLFFQNKSKLLLSEITKIIKFLIQIVIFLNSFEHKSIKTKVTLQTRVT